MGMMTFVKKFGLEQAINYLFKDPETNLHKILDWAERYVGNIYPNQIRMIREAVDDPDNPYHPYVLRLLNEVDHDVLKTVLVNFFINQNIEGYPKQIALQEKYDCNIPWTIIMDPTSACNLHCIGCWAAEYGNKLNLSFEELDDIIRQGKELGIYTYTYTGGEPLVRKKDIIRLCEKHDDCAFMCFTNGTLIDEAFADDMLRVKNFVPVISLEGMEEATDSRRGKGVFQRVMHAMDILKARKLPFGISNCYTSQNYKSLTSEEYFDMLIDKGAYFAWYFHYMPVGNDAAPELMPNPEQREYVYRHIRDIRQRKPLFTMDFQNDAEFVGGCIAGGRRFFHINANGDMDPCVFVHYSDSNIRDKTVLEALRSPLFKAYHDGQPFNDNMFRPCPMLENPELLRAMIKKTNAKSTDLVSPESVDHLCDKCEPYAEAWKDKADDLWEEIPEERREYVLTNNTKH